MLLKVNNLSFAYDRRAILQNVSFAIEAGEVVGVLGANGAGKSTLLKCIVNVLRPETTSLMLLKGRLVSSYRMQELCREICYLTQLSSLSNLTIFELVLLGRKPHYTYFPGRADYQCVQECITTLGLERLAFQRLDSVSGGELQKALVAKALAQNPSLMLMDEPTNHLDVKARYEVMTQVRLLAQSKRIGVLMAIHDLNLAMQYMDRLLVLHNGHLVSHGSPGDISEDVLSQAFSLDLKVRKVDNGSLVVIHG